MKRAARLAYLVAVVSAGCDEADVHDEPEVGTAGKADEPGQCGAAEGETDDEASTECVEAGTLLAFESPFAGSAQTILVAGTNSDHQLSIVRFGEDVRRFPIETDIEDTVLDIKSEDGLFAVLFSEGRVLVVDGDSGTTVGTFDAALGEDQPPFAVGFGPDRSILVTYEESNLVRAFEAATGTELPAYEFAAPGDASVQGRHVLTIGDKLYAVFAKGFVFEPEGGYLAVFDAATGDQLNAIDLVWGPAEDIEATPVLNPMLPIVYDAARNRLFIEGKGQRPVDTGVTLKVDAETLAIDSDASDFATAFNGHRVISETHSKAIVLEHTSTPVASTHIHAFGILDNGDFDGGSDGPTILDLFEETDLVTLSEDGNYVALANTCFIGFCTAGKGVNFIDVAAETKLPKLTHDVLGFAPQWSVFLQH